MGSTPDHTGGREFESPYGAKMKSFHNGHEPSRRRARSGTVRYSNHAWDSITDKGNSNRVGRATGWMRIDF